MKTRTRKRPSPLALDPTRLGPLRKQFKRELRRRFRQFRQELLDLVAEEDAFGLMPPTGDVADLFRTNALPLIVHREPARSEYVVWADDAWRAVAREKAARAEIVGPAGRRYVLLDGPAVENEWLEFGVNAAAKGGKSGSYFGVCPRDKKGHCLPSGAAGAAGAKAPPSGADAGGKAESPGDALRRQLREVQEKYAKQKDAAPAKAPDKAPPRPGAFKAGQELTVQQITDYLARSKDPKAMAQLLAEASVPAGMVKRGGPGSGHGMAKEEAMRKLRVDGVDFLYPERTLSTTHDFLGKVFQEAKGMPPKLWKATREVVVTNQDAVFSESKTGKHLEGYFASKVTVATGGDKDRSTVFYLGGLHSPGTFTHEAGHNLARQLWGKTTPPETSGYGKVQAKWELGVSSYGRIHTAEDFAEGVRLHVTGRAAFREKFPRKDRELAKILGTEDGTEDARVRKVTTWRDRVYDWVTGNQQPAAAFLAGKAQVHHGTLAKQYGKRQAAAILASARSQGSLPVLEETYRQAKRGLGRLRKKATAGVTNRLSGRLVANVAAKLTEAEVERLARDVVRTLTEDYRRWLVETGGGKTGEQTGENRGMGDFSLNTRWKFLALPEKVAAFSGWVRERLSNLIDGGADLWQRFVTEGFQRGAGRAFDDANRSRRWRPGEGAFYAGSKQEFLRSAFGQPESADKVKLLAERVLADLKGVTEQTALAVTRVLADGLARGQGPAEVAKTLAAEVPGFAARAELTADWFLSRAHSDGQLQAFAALGVEEVGAVVEWMTAGPNDRRVCPKCKAMRGKRFTLEQAQGRIPLHLRCRCSWSPARVGERPPSRRLAFTGNAFCPTGKGGGIDPTCSPGGGKGGPAAAPYAPGSLGAAMEAKKDAFFDALEKANSTKAQRAAAKEHRPGLVAAASEWAMAEGQKALANLPRDTGMSADDLAPLRSFPNHLARAMASHVRFGIESAVMGNVLGARVRSEERGKAERAWRDHFAPKNLSHRIDDAVDATGAGERIQARQTRRKERAVEDWRKLCEDTRYALSRSFDREFAPAWDDTLRSLFGSLKVPYDPHRNDLPTTPKELRGNPLTWMGWAAVR